MESEGYGGLIIHALIQHFQYLKVHSKVAAPDKVKILEPSRGHVSVEDLGVGESFHLVHKINMFPDVDQETDKGRADCDNDNDPEDDERVLVQDVRRDLAHHFDGNRRSLDRVIPDIVEIAHRKRRQELIPRRRPVAQLKVIIRAAGVPRKIDPVWTVIFEAVVSQPV